MSKEFPSTDNKFPLIDKRDYLINEIFSTMDKGDREIKKKSPANGKIFYSVHKENYTTDKRGPTYCKKHRALDNKDPTLDKKYHAADKEDPAIDKKYHAVTAD